MYKVVAMAEMYPVVEEALRVGNRITITVTGTSMLPLLRHQLDNATLEPVTGPMHVNDVVLYQRENGQFVLHRIIGMEKNGDCILCGDNQLVCEHHVRRQQVVGRLTAFTRIGRKVACTSVWYKAYICVLPALRLILRGCLIARRYAGTLRYLIIHLANRNG